jgi:predicted amidohydrolase YtcJ
MITKIKKAYINAKIYTVNNSQKWADCVLTEDNKLSFVGSYSEAKKIIDTNTEVIDLKGALMLPGFIDSHAHTILGGLSLMSVDLSESKSKNEFSSILKNYVSENKNRWVEGGNWNHHNWENGETPKKEWIDHFSSDTPIFVSRMDLHMALANSCALKLAEITKDTPNPPGGIIEKDPDTGEPTGILKDKAMDLIYDVIPKTSKTELYNAGLAALREAKRFGVTSIHDITTLDDLEILKMLEQKGDLSCRVYSRLPIEHCELLFDNKMQDELTSDKISFGSVKAFWDGSLGSSTALFFDPYKDDKNNYGIAMDYILDGRIENWAIECDKNHLQLSIHSIGDKAISDLLDLFEKIETINPGRDRRFRIEHAQHLRKQDIKRFARLNVIASMQPYHLYDDGVWVEKKIGLERMNGFLAFNTFLNNKVKICFGSDWSVSTLNPIKGIYTAVTRQTACGTNPNGLIPEEKISAEEAVECYTINAAYAEFAENKKGSIEVGKFADMVVLSENIFEIPPEEIQNVSVLKTIFDGKEIYNQQ